MQSELSNHIGLNGNLFCHTCKVQTSTAAVETEDSGRGNGNGSFAGSVASSNVQSMSDNQRARGRALELTMLHYVEKARQFLTVSAICLTI